jgi:hypothetical protein
VSVDPFQRVTTTAITVCGKHDACELPALARGAYGASCGVLVTAQHFSGFEGTWLTPLGTAHKSGSRFCVGPDDAVTLENCDLSGEPATRSVGICLSFDTHCKI